MQENYNETPASLPTDELSLAEDGEVTNEELSKEAENEDEKEEPNEQSDIESPDYAQIAKEDLSEIKRLFPNLSDISDIRQLDNASRFGELRDSGLSVEEALMATNFTRLLTSVAEKTARYNEKSHLRSAVPTASAPSGISMSADELRSAREIFSNLSDREIEKLYKKVML